MVLRDKPGPRHAAIAAEIRGQIESGALPPGAALPSESELLERFSVSRGTVRQALASLRSEGLVSGGRGRRPVVSRSPLTQSFDQLISFSAWAESLGRTPSARTLELARRPAGPTEADAMGLEPGTAIFQYKRVRLLDGEPAMIEVSTFIEEIGVLLIGCDLDGGSVYAQLAERGVVFSEANQAIAAIAADAEQAALLEIPRRSPLLEVTRTVFNLQGAAVEYSRDSYRGDAFLITLHNQVALTRSGVGLALVS
jgi:GntR family transcriptional regulator